jgi:crescentin
MRNIIDILWKRDPSSPDLEQSEAVEAAFALLDAPTEAAEAETGLDSVQRLGQENETFRLLFLSAQTKIDELEKLKSAFDLLSAPLERNLRTIEGLKIENTGLRSGLMEARDKIGLLRSDVAAFERKVDGLETERLALTQDVRSSRELITTLESTKSEQAQDIAEARSKLAEFERQLAYAMEYQKSLETDQQAARDMIVMKDTQIAQFDADISRLNETVAMLESENTNLSETLAGRVEDYNRTSRRLTEVENDLEATRNRLNHTRTLLNETKNERKALSDQMDEANAQFQAEKISLTMKVDAMQSRVTLGERLLTEARNSLIAKTDELRNAERRLVDNNVALTSFEQRVSKQKATIDSLERQVRDLEQSRVTLIERSTALTKNLKARDTALAKLDDRIPVLMGRIDQLETMAESNRATYQARVDELTAALETERMARAVAEGALEMARKERGALQRELVRSEGAPRVSEVADTVLDLSAKLGPQPAADGTTG